MTKILTLLRHAKTIEATAAGNDHERFLTERGQKAAEFVGLETKTDVPQLVLCSSSRRTVETVNALVAAWGQRPEILVERGLYLSSATALRRRIEQIDDAYDRVWIVAHNPGLHDLARQFASNTGGVDDFPELAFRFPTAARAVFESDAQSWGLFTDKPLRLRGVRFL